MAIRLGRQQSAAHRRRASRPRTCLCVLLDSSLAANTGSGARVGSVRFVRVYIHALFVKGNEGRPGQTEGIQDRRLQPGALRKLRVFFLPGCLTRSAQGTPLEKEVKLAAALNDPVQCRRSSWA